ncbi:MAG: cytochrome P450, partial [Stackebrandtia sp.]
LNAGHEASVNVFGNGVVAMLSRGLSPDTGSLPECVEEMLRFDSALQLFERTATVVVRIGDVYVQEGQKIGALLGAANRDPERFTDPDTLDIRRRSTGHLAFSHGIHQCLGQQLARTEMRIAFPALINRFPTLRLDVAAEDVGLRPETADIYGVKSLPVTWDG